MVLKTLILSIAVLTGISCFAQQEIKDFFIIEHALNYLNSPSFRNDLLDTIKKRCDFITMRKDLKRRERKRLLEQASDTSVILRNVCYAPFDYYLMQDTVFTKENIYLYRVGYAKMKMLLHYAPPENCNRFIRVVATFLENGNLKLEYFPAPGSSAPIGIVFGETIYVELNFDNGNSSKLISFGRIINNPLP